MADYNDYSGSQWCMGDTNVCGSMRDTKVNLPFLQDACACVAPCANWTEVSGARAVAPNVQS